MCEQWLVSTLVWLCPAPGQHCLAWLLIKLHFLTIFLIEGLCILGKWSSSSLTSTDLLESSTPDNKYVCIIFIDIYICIYMRIYVSHSFACEYSCHSVAFSRWKEGRKLQIRGIQESQSAISVDTKDLHTQLIYLLSKNMASKDIGSNLFQEGQAYVVIQKAKKASFRSTRSQSFIRLMKILKHCLLALQVTLI